jgi:peptide/nickel transport system permease protein
MIVFILRRLFVHGLAIMLLVTATVFFVTRMLTDPVRAMLPQTATQEDYDTLEHAIGMDQPILSQFVDFLAGLVTLDFGVSYWTGQPAMEVVLERLPATFQLVAVSMAMSLLLFAPIGVLASLRPGGRLDRFLVTVSLFGVSAPQFWLGAMLIWLFSLQLGWLPTSGAGTPAHIVLPALTLALTSGGRIAQITRSTLIDQFQMPYVTTLTAKGLSTTSILLRHVLRNAMVPIVTVSMFELAYALTGYAVIVETVFSWPGIGRLAVQAVTQRDLILLQALVCVCALLVVVANIIADLLYKAIDPRIKLA